MKMQNGLVGLWKSRKGVAFLLTLFITAFLSWFVKLTPTFGVVIGIIFGIFSATHAYQQVNKDNSEGMGDGKTP